MSNLLNLTPQKFPRLLVLLITTFYASVFSQNVLAHGPTPGTLKGIAVPETPGLVDGTHPIVVDKAMAIALGKALFWDANVGSDGMACGSCHFHAGADSRTKNQLAPGLLHLNATTASTFETTASGLIGRVNVELRKSDFPLYQLANPNDKKSTVLYNTDDVVSSSGTFHSKFQAVNVTGSGTDKCESTHDTVFHSNNFNTRQVQARNTPTVINAAFNFRNFWDGRANNVFNGVSPFGTRDRAAGIWIVQSDGSVHKTPLRLMNAALASQAVAPALNNQEMSCAERTFPELGRKLLSRRPLEIQKVHPNDSVLATLRHNTLKGLNTTYSALIKKAFAARYWSGTGEFGLAQTGVTPYNQMEANFSLFFGLALQLYENTLISDDTPFDTPRDVVTGVPSGLSTQQARGLIVFKEAHCSNCHKGPTLSAAAHPAIYNVPSETGLMLINRKTLKGSATGSGVAFALMDEGFVNTSVTPTNYDIGVGGKDPFDNPLSFTEQYVRFLQGKTTKMVDNIKIKSCALDVPFEFDFISTELVNDPFGVSGCGSRNIYAKVPSVAAITSEQVKLEQGRMLAATQGAFKIPTLRNIELTGPYMHNGSMKTLEEVVEFYNRGGNFNNRNHFGTLVFPQGLNQDQKTDLVAFLKSLTDERVRWEKAPFDHPELLIPQGHTLNVSAKNPNQLQDSFLSVIAVGKEGRSAAMKPLQPFESYLKP